MEGELFTDGGNRVGMFVGKVYIPTWGTYGYLFYEPSTGNLKKVSLSWFYDYYTHLT